MQNFIVAGLVAAAAVSAVTASDLNELVELFPNEIRFTYPGWKYKALTFSYDDATIHDRKLIGIFNRYGMKATFNLSSQRLGPEKGRFVSAGEIAALYLGHEVAGHGEHHLAMAALSAIEQEHEIVRDRIALEKQTGKLVRGFAYPYGNCSEAVAQCLRDHGIVYARTCTSTGGFSLPENPLFWNPTAHHSENIMELGRKYLDYEGWGGILSVCYIWGHSYEFADAGNWDLIEDFCRQMAHRDDIWYAANIEIIDYLQACKRLKTSIDSSMAENTSAVTLFLMVNGVRVELPPGATLQIREGKIRITAPTHAVTPPVDNHTGAATGKLCFPGGVRKAVSFSYDDGLDEDAKIIEILNRYGMKGTFNINASSVLEHPQRLVRYRGHEIATHGFRHATFGCVPAAKIVEEIFLDRKILEQLTGVIITGHAYPNGSTYSATPDAIAVLRASGIEYARGTRSTRQFAVPTDFLVWEPSAHNIADRLPELARTFLASDAAEDLQVCLVWGHAFEFKTPEDWNQLEQFCATLSGENIWKATNGEICNYLLAARSLQWSADRSFVHNPTSSDILVSLGEKIVTIAPGETLSLN